jgi:hypothetical protein
MAESDVDELVRRMYQRVATDTGGRAGAQPPTVTDPTIRARLERFWENRDIPARLASPGPWAGRDAEDQRPQIRVALTKLVARCANGLEPKESLPPAADQAAQDRLGESLSDLYASERTRELWWRLARNGPDDLGVFERPILEGDAAAARALTVALGARTRQRADVVLRELVGAGRGGAALAAARMLLDLRSDYATLPGAAQGEAVVRTVAAALEARFAARDPERVAARELTPEIENRREDITGGAGSIDEASAVADRSVQELHRFLDTLPEWHPANLERAAARAAVASPAAQIERPASVPELMERIHGAVAELTDTHETRWNGNTETLRSDPSGRTLRLTD